MSWIADRDYRSVGFGMMRFRTLGRTGLSVSECAIGASALSASDLDRAEASAAIALALERGINAMEIDGGDTRAASLIGEILRREDARNRIQILSRISSLTPFDLPSPHVTAQQAYPGRHIRAETERLLETLGVDRLALQQLHAWCPEWRHEGDWFETLDRLRHEGKIAGIGVSLFDHDVESAFEIVASGMIDAVQTMYNIFDQGAAAALFPLCGKHGVGAIARSPLYYGAIASSTAPLEFPSDDWRSAYFYAEHWRETTERVQRLACDAAPPDRSPSDLALRFALSHPAVSTVVVGMRSRAHVEANFRALDHGPLSPDAHAQLTRHAWLCSNHPA
jgi:aryl-alcohol dehydrogenase-like predicted oxidoreductase